jgi:hypothetical protein
VRRGEVPEDWQEKTEQLDELGREADVRVGESLAGLAWQRAGDSFHNWHDIASLRTQVSPEALAYHSCNTSCNGL